MTQDVVNPDSASEKPPVPEESPAPEAAPQETSAGTASPAPPASSEETQSAPQPAPSPAEEEETENSGADHASGNPEIGAEQAQESSPPPAKKFTVLKVIGRVLLHTIPFLLAAGLTAAGWPIYRNYEGSEQTVAGLPIHVAVGNAVWGGALVLLCLISLIRRRRFPISAGFTMLCFAPFVSFAIVQMFCGYNIFSYQPLRFWINLAIYFAVYLFLYVVSKKIRIALIAGSTLFLIYGYADYYVYLFRGSPFLPFDLLSAGTAMDVIGGYTFVFPTEIILGTLLWLSLVLASFTFRDDRTRYFGLRCTMLPRIALAAGSAVFLISMGTTQMFNNLEIYNDPWDMAGSRSNNGSLLNFCLNIQFMVVEKPEGYSVERVQEIVDNLTVSSEPASDIRAKNVIVIMNESLADLNVIGDANLSEDNLPFIHSLTENAIKGNCYVSIFGGGTCNSEFEALTGNSIAFLPLSSIAFQQYIKEDTTSLGSLFGSLGYDTYAMHPYLGSAWQRDRVYPLLGFDEFWDFYDYENPQMVRNLMSDEGDFQKLIQTYEEKELGSDLMMFNVTIQNHGGYNDPDYVTTVYPTDCQGQYPNTEQYLSLIKDSDAAFQNLVEYFSQVEEPTIILMFGDHQPKIEDAFYEKLFGKSLEELDQEETERRYQTPLRALGQLRYPRGGDGYWLQLSVHPAFGYGWGASFRLQPLFKGDARDHPCIQPVRLSGRGWHPPFPGRGKRVFPAD